MNVVFKLIFALIYSSYALFIGPFSVWLLFNAQTAVGRMLALIGLLSLLVPLLAAAPRRKQRNLLNGLLGAAALSMIGLGTAVLLSAPSGNPGPDSPVQQRYVGNGEYGRFALTNIVPEAEQINLGFTLMPYVDPLLTVEQSDRVSVFTMDIYQEMEQDAHFHELGSAMNLAYAELLGQQFNVGHYYLYIPPNAPETPRPALVFLHGSAGNFKAYTWIWSKLAEAEGFVLIVPSYGFGNWNEAGVQSVFQILDDAQQRVSIDASQIYLAGLSNGGIGVSRLAVAAPEMFRGLIYLSPVMPPNIVDSPAFQTAWANRPILIVSGEADKRIPISYVQQRIANFEKANINVTIKRYPNEDHFLVFSQPDSIRQTIAEWLSGVKQ